MVKTIGSISPRSTGTFELESQRTDNGIVQPAQNEIRRTFRFISTLDVYAELEVLGTDSTDPNFTNSVQVNSTRPLPAGTVREHEDTGPYEYLKFEITTQEAPTEGTVACVVLQDNSPPSAHERLILDEDIHQGKGYLTSVHEQILGDDTTTLGVRNPTDTGIEVVLHRIGLIATGNATISYEIDHSSYSDGTIVDLVNRRPELQIEKPAGSVVTLNPTVSGAQKSTNGVLPGGTKSAGSGTTSETVSFVLDPGQDLTISMTNVSGGENRYGFNIGIVEKAI